MVYVYETPVSLGTQGNEQAHDIGHSWPAQGTGRVFCSVWRPPSEVMSMELRSGLGEVGSC